MRSVQFSWRPWLHGCSESSLSTFVWVWVFMAALRRAMQFLVIHYTAWHDEKKIIFIWNKQMHSLKNRAQGKVSLLHLHLFIHWSLVNMHTFEILALCYACCLLAFLRAIYKGRVELPLRELLLWLLLCNTMKQLKTRAADIKERPLCLSLH